MSNSLPLSHTSGRDRDKKPLCLVAPMLAWQHTCFVTQRSEVQPVTCCDVAMPQGKDVLTWTVMELMCEAKIVLDLMEGERWNLDLDLGLY